MMTSFLAVLVLNLQVFAFSLEAGDQRRREYEACSASEGDVDEGDLLCAETEDLKPHEKLSSSTGSNLEDLEPGPDGASSAVSNHEDLDGLSSIGSNHEDLNPGPDSSTASNHKNLEPGPDELSGAAPNHEEVLKPPGPEELAGTVFHHEDLNHGPGGLSSGDTCNAREGYEGECGAQDTDTRTVDHREHREDLDGREQDNSSNLSASGDDTRTSESRASDASSNVSEKHSEFKCEFHWYDEELEHLKSKVSDWMKERQKIFNRFIVPVIGYNNSDLPKGGNNFTGVLTWVWVSEKHRYMLHYPHNFVSLSTLSMGVITQDWALDYNTSLGHPSLTLSGNSIDIDDDIYEYERGLGYCDSGCLMANRSCGLGKHEMVELLNSIKHPSNFEWNWLCLQLEYEDVHAVAQTGSRPNFLIPDVLYYVLFIRKLLTERPVLGLPTDDDKFLHYHCYERTNPTKSKPKELHEKYFIIPFLAVVLWLYIPFLLHYFPSSSKLIDPHFEGMLSTQKMPVYFGRCLKKMFCFYTKGDSKLIRLRRCVFLVILFLSSFRLFFLPCWMYIACVAATLALATLYPVHLSTYIVEADVKTSNKKFAVLGWEFTPGLIRVNPALKEYQLLASMMQERMYLLVDRRFWEFLFNNSFAVGTVRGILLLITASMIYIFYYFVPLPYFVLEVSTAIFFSGQNPKLISIVCRFFIFAMFIYSVIVSFFWCYAITEFGVFTLIGGVISPTIILPYFVLVSTLVGTIYSLIHSLHKHYEEILEVIIEILNSEKKIRTVQSFKELEKTENTDLPSEYMISVTHGQQNTLDLLKQTVPVTYVSKELYDYVVEQCSPVRRNVFFIVIQVLAIFVYAPIALSTKNVFHLEDKVGTIFQLIITFSIAFVPGVLRFLAYKSHFGKKAGVVLKKNVYSAMSDYFSQLP